MAIAFIEGSDATGFGGNRSVTVGAVVPVGALIFVGFLNDSTFDISTITDDGGNDYVLQSAQENGNPSDTWAIQTAYSIATNQLNPGDTIDITCSGGNSSASYLSATGLAAFDDESTGLDEAFPQSATMDSGDVVTTEADALLVGYNSALDGAKTFTAPSTDFTQVHDVPSIGSVFRYQLEYRIVSATGTYTTDATLSSASYWVSRLTAFKAGGGGVDTGLAWIRA